jgi:hypothetical protein
MAIGVKTGGRKKGTPNRITRARREALLRVEEQLAQTMGEAFTADAHALLVAIYKDPSQPLIMRLDAAKAAIGYEKPKLSAVDASVNGVIGQYTAQPIPVERRDSDSLDNVAEPGVNGHSAGHG